MYINEVMPNSTNTKAYCTMRGAKVNSDELMKTIVKKGRQTLSSLVERMVPENGKFTDVAISFDIPKTNKETVLSIVHDEVEPKILRRIKLGVHNINSDRFFSVYLKKGTKNELFKYLNSTNSEIEILSSVEKLSKQVDEFYSSL